MGLPLMRKKTIRNGMRLVLAALIIIIIASFYHSGVSDILSLSYDAEMRFYRLGIFWAAAIGSYGVVQSAFGLVLPAKQGDSVVRIMPSLFLIIGAVSLFFYLLAASFDASSEPTRERLRPGETITI
jgi:hypothetical protein